MTMALRVRAAIPMLAAVVGVCAACGGSTVASKAAPPDNPNAVAPTPHAVPANFTTVKQMSRALRGVATCKPDGGPLLFCSLVTATNETFVVRVFSTTAGTAAYLATIHAQDQVAIHQGETPRGALHGLTWVAVAKITAPDVLATLQPYLGGSLFA